MIQEQKITCALKEGGVFISYLVLLTKLEESMTFIRSASFLRISNKNKEK